MMKGKCMQKQESKIAAQINLLKLPANSKYEIELNQSTDWVNNLLNELNENAVNDPAAFGLLKQSALTITGEVEKKTKIDLGEFLLAVGSIHAIYTTECIRTLRPMRMELTVPFKVCFLDVALESSEMFAETDETWVDNDVYDIYYYNKRTVNFQDMIHEQIFLNYNQYPVLDAECQLPGVTGENSKS